MAKKKKKLLKYNQIIRSYFDGNGFDEGITRVPLKNLIELSQILDIKDIELTQEQLIRAFRRVWSEADVEPRQKIVFYFKKLGKVFSDDENRDISNDKLKKIETFLEQLSLSKEEASILKKEFLRERSKRISLPKLEKALNKLRFEQKLLSLEKSLDFNFNEQLALLFFTPVSFNYLDENFTKILQVTSEPLSKTFLKESSYDELYKYLKELKGSLALLKQQEANSFIAALPSPHPYLKNDEILLILKTMPPQINFKQIPIEAKIMQEIFKRNFHAHHLQLLDYNLILHKEAHLPYEDHTFSYEAVVEINLEEILPPLWRGDKIDFEEEFSLHNQMMENSFKDELKELIKECEESASILDIPRSQIVSSVIQEVEKYREDNLHISSKIHKRILVSFNNNISKLKLKKQREILLARTIRDFKNLFPTARELHRKLIFHVGPTNSGKTYEAMQALKNADTGYYLAPLRLLALEGYENIKEHGISASLITGEEQMLEEYATHISSTIEMLDFNVDVDVCVIDEIQMLADRDRGWAWANAIIGAPAKTVYMTGSLDALNAIEALAQWLGEELEVKYFERKAPLSILKTATPINNIEPQTAVIAFSRKEVLQLKQQLSRHYKVSVIYGNLSPEVRREEARRFREGETEVLVATDAISMGLNLPIKTILFSKDSKFDGERRRTLNANEVIQIAGRAGRFGIHEKGYVGALTPAVLKTIHEQFHKTLKEISLPLNVMANLEHIRLVGKILETDNLEEVLRFFIKHMTFDGPFRVANLETLIEIAKYTDRYALSLETKYHLACAPLSTQSTYLVQVFSSYVEHMHKNKPIAYTQSKLYGEYADSMETLLHVEDLVKEVSLYLWLSYRFPEIFFEPQKAKEARIQLNKYIQNSLKNGQFVPKCRICTKPLALDSKHNICNSCFYRRKDRNKNSHKPSKQRSYRR